MAAAVPWLAGRSVDRSAGRSSAACARRAPQRSRRQARTHPLRDSRRLACEARRISTDVLGRESPELSRDAARGFAPRGTRLRRAAGDERRARRPCGRRSGQTLNQLLYSRAKLAPVRPRIERSQAVNSGFAAPSIRSDHPAESRSTMRKTAQESQESRRGQKTRFFGAWGFRDRRIQPLCHPSKGSAKANASCVRSAAQPSSAWLPLRPRQARSRGMTPMIRFTPSPDRRPLLDCDGCEAVEPGDCMRVADAKALGGVGG
jgi:hypothetical protein